MGIIKRTPADAMRDAATATAKAAELEAQAAEAEATAKRMDTESLAALVDNPEQAEGINAKIAAQERLARAYRLKASECRDKVPNLHREALELEAAELDRQAERIDRDADKLAEKVADARRALEDLDGYAWERKALEFDSITKEGTTWSVDGAAGDKRGQGETLRIKARQNRFYIEHERVAQHVDEFRFGPNFNNMSGLPTGPRIDDPDYTTDLLSQIAGGNVPVEA